MTSGELLGWVSHCCESFGLDDWSVSTIWENGVEVLGSLIGLEVLAWMNSVGVVPWVIGVMVMLFQVTGVDMFNWMTGVIVLGLVIDG